MRGEPTDKDLVTVERFRRFLELAGPAQALEEPETHSSHHWLETERYRGVIVHDPDGWDRGRLVESFNELITLEEFQRRLFLSSIEERTDDDGEVVTAHVEPEWIDDLVDDAEDAPTWRVWLGLP